MVFRGLRSRYKPGQHVERNHPQRALHGRGKAGKQRITERREDGQECGRNPRQAEAARDPEQASGHNGKVQARDHKHVKRTGALKAHTKGVIEVRAVARGHGGQHHRVVVVQAQRGRQFAHGGGQGQQAHAGGVLQLADAAGRE
jgi:hypothetical protein